MYDFIKFKEDINNIKNWLIKEFSNIRTGIISISILDNVKSENYGVLTPINQLANIAIEDVKTLRISPWDQSQIKEIEKAIINANLGVSIAVDDKGIRLSFSDLTGERRVELVKNAKDKLEQAKISLRVERDKVWNDIQDKEKKDEITQDDKFRLKDEMQKIIDDETKVLVELFEKKEKEIKD
ncbi:MAG: ribosome recycling factor [Candidatus Pacebacteria bacterium]|nr:ribosome recycling factor [Candidatus Paceibacterota bacterium]